jgi:hypothetical protein
MTVVMAMALCWCAAKGELVLAEGGRSNFVIVVGREASPSEKHAAQELQSFLEQISGARLPVRDDQGPLGEHEIILGDNAHLRQLGVQIDFAKLGDEGFTLRTVGPHLVIAGGRLRGTMYGVYTCLETYLGCRWLAPDQSIIPKRARIAIGPVSDTQVPALEYREPFYADAFDADWCARNKMNSSASPLDEQRGGKITYYGFVHTFNSLLPPEKYFEQHPEYYALVNGRRLREYTQLCCTNPEVQRLVAEEVKRRMREHPEAKIFSVSQNDWGNYCQCERCRAVAEREGSQIGPILELVNYVADQVRDEFPDRIIDTLAYQYSRKPPKHLRPRPNVVVRLCSIECCFAHPLETCDHPNNVAFRTDLEGWSKVCQRLWVWDYVVDFPHYLLPFPNLRVLQANIKFFVRHNVRGIFEEGDYNTVNGEFAKLRAYLLAKFLWNPDYPFEQALTEFLEGYYGPAAGPIRQYIDLLHDKVQRENLHAFIWENPGAAYLSEEVLTRGQQLFDEAERLVSSDPERLRRVQIARLPLYYVALERYRPGPRVFRLAEDFFRPDPDPDLQALWSKFTRIAAEGNVTFVGEGDGRSMAVYRQRKEPLVSGHRLASLETNRLRVQVAPGLGGRLLAITHLPSGRQLCYLGSPADLGYPAVGGYGGWWRNNQQGPGWDAAFDCHTDPAQRTLTLTADICPQIHVERVVEVADPDRVVIRETLVNRTASAQPRQYWTHLRLAVAPPEAVVQVGQRLVALSATGELPVGGVALGPEEAAGGVNLHLGRGLLLSARLRGAGLLGAGISYDPSRQMLLLAAHLAGDLPPQASSQLTWELQLGQAPPVPPAPHPPAGLVVSQEDEWRLAREGDWARIDFDPTATNGFAAWMGGHHFEWAVQWPYAAARFQPGQAYDVFARVKVSPAEGKTTGEAFTAGVWDTGQATSRAARSVALAEIKPNTWQVWKIGTLQPADGQYVWLAPTRQLGNIKAMWVDCLWMVPAGATAR